MVCYSSPDDIFIYILQAIIIKKYNGSLSILLPI